MTALSVKAPIQSYCRAMEHALQSAAVLTCHRCGLAHAPSQIPEGASAVCSRCNAVILRNTKNSLARTAAFSLAALVLYIPANIFPILHFDLYGAVTDNTVWQGVVRLYADGDTLVAVVVLLASIVIPLFKLATLFFLVVTTQQRSPRLQALRGSLHHLLEVVGPWAMLDVFLVAVLVSLVKLQKLATILPGPGLLSFSAVVVFTLLASTSFDSRLIWAKAKS